MATAGWFCWEKKRVVDQLPTSQVDYAALEKQIDEEQRQYEAGTDVWNGKSTAYGNLPGESTGNI